jgi:glutamate transport system permease protein
MTSVLYDVPGPKAKVRARIVSWVTGLIVVAVLGYVGLTLWQKGMWDPTRWDIFNDPLVWAALLRGLVVVLQSALVATVLALLLGMVFSLLRMSSHRIVRIPITVVLEFFRGMPVLLMMLFILLAFPGVSAFWAVVSALAVYNGAIIGEALRSGVVALPKGQREAGLAIGMRPLQTRLQIEFPQAFRNMLPIIVAQIVVLLKDTALGYIVGQVALIREGELLAEFVGRQQYFFSIFLVMLAMYLAVNLTISTIARQLAKRRGITVSKVVADESLSVQT